MDHAALVEFVGRTLREAEDVRLRAETDPRISIDFANGVCAGLALVLEHLSPGSVAERAGNANAAARGAQ